MGPHRKNLTSSAFICVHLRFPHLTATLTDTYRSRMDDMAIKAARRKSLHDLAAMVERVENRGGSGGWDGEAVATGLDRPLDGIERRVLHEWLCGDEANQTDQAEQPWTAPILVLTHLARVALRQAHSDDATGHLIAWIGRRTWPQPHVLARRSSPDEQPDLLARSLLIDAVSLDDRLWATDLCLRSEAAGVVIADVSGMRMAHSRRLQLAAESGRALALLARPAKERKEHSAAARRWRIKPIVSGSASPRWQIELVRCKGMQRGDGTEAASMNSSTLVVEHDHQAHCLRPVPDLVDRPGAAASSPIAHAQFIRRTG